MLSVLGHRHGPVRVCDGSVQLRREPRCDQCRFRHGQCPQPAPQDNRNRVEQSTN
jgi:hypothetical protein